MTELRFTYEDAHPKRIARESIAEDDFEIVLWEQAEPDEQTAKGYSVFYTITDVSIDKKSGAVTLHRITDCGRDFKLAVEEFEGIDEDLTNEAVMAAEAAAGWPRYAHMSDEEERRDERRQMGIID